MGSSHRETDESMRPGVFICLRPLEPMMKHKEGVDPHRFPLFYANRLCRYRSLLWLVTSSVLMVKDNFVRYLALSEEIFQTIPK